MGVAVGEGGSQASISLFSSLPNNQASIVVLFPFNFVSLCYFIWCLFPLEALMPACHSYQNPSHGEDQAVEFAEHPQVSSAGDAVSMQVHPNEEWGG